MRRRDFLTALGGTALLAEANAQPPRLPDWRTLHPDAERKLDDANGISWGTMGVNGNRHHKHARTTRKSRLKARLVFIVH